ncbi:MAG: protein-disulfide reductase DsbD domain-containing protein [Dehalococcoidia bacterium]
MALPVDTSSHPSAKDEAGVSAVLASPALTFQQKTAILARIALPPGLHAYGLPVPAGYIPTTVSVRGPENVEIGQAIYPPTTPFRVEGLDEEFHVFEGDIEIEVPILSSEYQAESVKFEVEIRYQACDDQTCFLPQTVNLTIEAPVKGVNRPPRRT